jgi:hypothetical protein
MEKEGTGTKYMAANCEGSQSPPRAVELRKKKKNKISIPRLGFEPTTPVFEREKTVHALELAATVIGQLLRLHFINHCLKE